MNINKQIKKIEHQNKVNPGHKEPYAQPLRPRSAVFKSKKTYNRQNDKIDIKKGKYDE
jgi:hypothetical protein